MKLDRTVSVCMSKDLLFWRVAARRLLDYVDACSYEVIVPDDEVTLFRRETQWRELKAKAPRELIVSI
jgi:hypothetical protein